MSSTLNIKSHPISRPRNYAPERTFITKWDVEIDNNRAKKIARTRDRDTKYFDYCEEVESLPVIVKQVEMDCCWELESDGETNAGWLRSVKEENDYYDREYGALNFEWYDMNELDTDETKPYKRNIEFDEQSLFKRARA